MNFRYIVWGAPHPEKLVVFCFCVFLRHLAVENNQNQLQKSQVVFMCVPPAERERPLRGLKRRDFGGWESHQAIGEAIALRCHVTCFQNAWKRAMERNISRWWFQICFIFTPKWGRFQF